MEEKEKTGEKPIEGSSEKRDFWRRVREEMDKDDEQDDSSPWFKTFAIFTVGIIMGVIIGWVMAPKKPKKA